MTCWEVKGLVFEEEDWEEWDDEEEDEDEEW
jgi:hypothetical protein